eukprot:2194378-Lingulodinium_polyedra.AAC.1
MPGRAAVLRLRGRHGALDLVVAYFPTGPRAFEQDLDGGEFAQDRQPSMPELRADLRRRLARRLSASDAALTVLGGDFNYVAQDGDRRSVSSCGPSG